VTAVSRDAVCDDPLVGSARRTAARIDQRAGAEVIACDGPDPATSSRAGIAAEGPGNQHPILLGIVP
jgi:hypothetical protein